MDDDKYNIHGLYLSDPTWDNNVEKDYFNNALMTFDTMQTNDRMFSHNSILDIHNFNEYNTQINFLLKRQLKEIENNSFIKNKSFQEKLIYAYKNIATTILLTIQCDIKSDYFIKQLITCLNEQDYINFYTELGHHLLTRINKPFSEKEIFKAHKEVLRVLNKENNLEETEKNYYERDIKQFPYEISNNEHSLNTRI